MKKTLLSLLLLGSCLLTNAQSRIPNLTQRLDPAAFRQSLIQQEATRQRAVAQFLRQKPLFQESFVDKKGAYSFLHHIDPDGQPVYYQTRSNLALATSINTNKLWSGGGLGLNLQGQGMEVSPARSRLGMFEPSPTRTTHQEFGGRAITRDLPLFTEQIPGSEEKAGTDHAAHVAGTMIATGVQPQARGMANQARLDCYEIQKDELMEMQTSASEGMLVSNHSYGPKYDATRVRLGMYDAYVRNYDVIGYLYKNYLQFHAAGNDRADDKDITYDILIGGAVGKNVATVGAVRLLDGGYTGPASVVIADFSSYGPTDDGRIKPDFVAPGVNIYSAYSGSDTDYKAIDGTSMASPGSAGSLFLLQQHYRNTKNGFMRAATLKGLAIHTAEEAGTTPGPDYRFGWGLLNLEKAINVINQTNGLSMMEEANLDNGATYQKRINTKGGPLKVTICWTDLPGTPLEGRDNRTPVLVNDLDLRLVNATTNQTITELPWKLDPINPAAGATRGDNVVDNVEQIFVDNLPAGQYFVRVTHKGTLQEGPQEFAVFATGTAPEEIANTPPTVANPIPNQSATVGQAFSYMIPANTFTDKETPNQLTLSVSGLPAGLMFTAPATISGTPSMSGTSTITVKATDPGNLTANTNFALTVNPAPVVVTSLSLTASASPNMIQTTGSTTLTAMASGGTAPYSYTFAGPGTISPNGNTATVSGLMAGVQTFTVMAKDATTPTNQVATAIVSVTVTAAPPANTAPTVANMIPAQSATVGQAFSYMIPANTFTDNETPSMLTLSVSGLPAGLMFTAPAIISGTPSVSGTSNVTVTATDPGGLMASTSFALTANPAPVVVVPGGQFAITGVTTVSCLTVTATRRSLTFTPQYSGTNGQPISFSIVNEKLPTTDPGPYTVAFYIDKPFVTLKATQSGTPNEASFNYNWLAACGVAPPDPQPTSPFAITGVTTVSCTPVAGDPNRRSLTFTPRYSGVNGQPISFSVVNEKLPTTAPGPYTIGLYLDKPTITLSAKQSGTAGEASFVYNWLAVCGTTPPDPQPTAGFAITAVTTVSCTPVVGDANRRQVKFTPLYSGANGQPISFSVVNEMLPTTAPGPYTIGLYLDKPTITLSAMQSGTAGEATFVYNWLANCNSSGARLGSEPGSGLQVRLLGNPVVDGQVSITVSGVLGQPLYLTLTDVQGQVIGTHQVREAETEERHRFNVSRQSAGLLLLKVSTPTESKLIRVLKAE